MTTKTQSNLPKTARHQLSNADARQTRFFSLKILRDRLDTIAGLLYPTFCFLCGRFISLKSQLPVCASCLPFIRTNPPPHCLRCGRHLLSSGQNHAACDSSRAESVDELHFALYHQGASRKLVHKLKLGQSEHLSGLLRHLVATYIEHSSLDPRLFERVVPICSYTSSLFQTSPALPDRIATVLAELGGGRLVRAFRRGGRKSKQTLLRLPDRLTNPGKTFELARSVSFAKTSVLLVDDVMTTGSTLAACARLLKNAGARRIGAFVLARGLKHPAPENVRP